MSEGLRTNGHFKNVADYICGSSPERLGKPRVLEGAPILDENELRCVLSELRKILQDALEILAPESSKPVFEKNGEKQCQAPSSK